MARDRALLNRTARPGPAPHELFGFSVDDDASLIFDPNPVTGGAAIVYDCAVDTPDCEGIVFLTQSTDPTRGIVAGAFD